MGATCCTTNNLSPKTDIDVQNRSRTIPSAQGVATDSSGSSSSSDNDIPMPNMDNCRIKSIAYPICFECGNDLTQKSDPLNAYQGVGIVCDICGFSKEHVLNANDQQILDKIPLFYYSCLQCNSVDMCSKCYERKFKECVGNVVPVSKVQ